MRLHAILRQPVTEPRWPTLQELTRRERYRRQTVAQIKATAMAQVHQGGAKAVSPNAIARGMAMSPPALYRYFDSRGSGLDHAADRIMPAAQRGMNVLLGVVAAAGEPPAERIPAVLERQIRRWNGRSCQHRLPTAVVHFGLVWWSRPHGLIVSTRSMCYWS
jgi:AcrR family transcriptional regulator